MMTPLDIILEVNQTVCGHWMRATCAGFSLVETLAQRQRHFVCGYAHARFRDSIPNGADWFDHYGHRSHDVNVEQV
jgi:hypothetical protein